MARHHGYSAKSVVGIFRDRTAAERTIDELLNRGFDRDYISVVMRGAEETKGFARETGVKEANVAKGAAAGAGVGATLGGAAGFLAGLGALAIPGIGPLLAAGPIAAGIAGALGGGATGGLVGGLVGLGIPEEEAKTYEQDVKAGNILIAVECGDKCDTAKSILEQSGAINYGRQKTIGGAMPKTETYGAQQTPLSEEEHKRVPPVERTSHHEEGRHHTRH